jgi:phosphatidylserine/phosphatidylglycerophosphate/cardiolipin synthase-like enzyme
VKVRLAAPPSAKPSQYQEIIHAQFMDLEKQKIIRYTTPKSGLMHNKFMVADGARIWTGSYNLTKNDTELNDNNAITFSNRLLAANYTAEFEEIWAYKHGKKNSTPTPHPSVMLGGTSVQSLFSPEDDMEGAMVREINKATNSIYVMAFGLSDDQIFGALSNAVSKGVKVFALFDLELSRQRSSQSGPLRDVKATVRISSNNGQMHHKVIVVDGNVVITGSPNFSNAAFEQNDENALIFTCPPLARAFIREFERCWQAKPYIFNKWSQQVQ